MSSTGICYLAGAGPGDLGLVTLRCKECVETADVLIYDALCNPDMLRWAKDDCEKIYAGKRAGDHAIPQDGINALIVEKSKEGKIVTRLKGGDPMVFGRGGEEAQELAAAGVAYEIVPGISSTIAGPCYAGIPVTHRSHNTQLTIFTGHEDPTKEVSSIDYEQLAKAPGTKVMLMGVARMKAITGELIKAGASPDLPVGLVRWATTGRQETLTGTLADIADQVKKTGFKSPAVAVFGEVVNLRKEINWFEERPLFGKRIVITRTRKQAGVLSRKLSDLGADTIELPTIRIEPPEDQRAFAELVMDCHTYDWIIFTSPNAVDAFFEWFYKIYKDARSIGGARIAAIGPGTANRINDFHLAVDLMPEKDHVAEGLVEAFRDEDKVGSIENQTFLWPKAAETRTIINDFLAEQSVILDEAIAYQTVPETDDVSGGHERFKEEGADIITFTSASTVESFFALGFELPKDCQLASIGPVTTEAIKKAGHTPDIEATTYTIPGLIDAILES